MTWPNKVINLYESRLIYVVVYLVCGERLRLVVWNWFFMSTTNPVGCSVTRNDVVFSFVNIFIVLFVEINCLLEAREGGYLNHPYLVA